MCTTCRIGAMSDSTVSLCFSGLAKNAILIQSCHPASNNSLESTIVLLSKAEKGTMEHIRSDASCLIAIVEQCYKWKFNFLDELEIEFSSKLKVNKTISEFSVKEEGGRRL